MTQSCWIGLLSFLCLLSTLQAIPTPGSSSSAGSSGILLRVRLADGSMERLQLEEGSEDTLTLGQVLKPLGVAEDASIRIANKTASSQQDLKSLQLKNGSLVTILPPPVDPEALAQAKAQAASKRQSKKRDWDPYPDLAKDYESVVRKTKTKRSSSSGMSYSDISKIQSSLHMVDPQKEGPIKRLYMCRNSAEGFYNHGVRKGTKKNPKASFETRFGLLLGTIQRERVDQRPKKARHSLSSQPTDSEYCTVTKVQAIWEPCGQQQRAVQGPNNNSKNGNMYDAELASTSLLEKNTKVLEIANCLGLSPVGWIFSYQDDRLQEDNSFQTDGPQALFGLDVGVGAKLKMEAMKAKQALGRTDENDLNETGDKFVTLAMDATTGATEAFQLSDVSIQMVHEDLFCNLLDFDDNNSNNKTKNSVLKNPPMVPTKHEVLVDGQETKLLDSVLCLVNTAVLSHVGSFSKSGSPTKKSNGTLTNKTKKLLAKALDSPEAGDFLKEACDFNILLALEELLAAGSSSSSTGITDDTKALCKLVKKWARGQKMGTTIDPKLKMKLKTYLS